nr:PocR ligand-binding domain-containing protein [uncultured Bacillus sp.]
MTLTETENPLLTDIIEIQTLGDIQNKLAKLVNFPIVTVDCDGKPIGKNNFTPFCELIRSSKKGADQCISCDVRAGHSAVQKRDPQIYDCHMGLKDCVAPIIVNDIFLGSVLGGQVLIEGEKTKHSIDIHRIAKEFDLPLHELREAVEQIQIVSQEYVESCLNFYNFLANHFAELGVHRLTQEKLLQEEREKLLLEQKTKKMELKTIQAQINPHFLFNTLNSVARMALMEDAPQTEDLIYKLSDLLRYNLKNIEEFPKLKNEIDNINRYLFIQSLRFSDRISYQINMDEDILDFRIPSMILQPLVENSMVHGLETKIEGGEIKISGHARKDDSIVLIISDNGTGIEPELLKHLNELHKANNDSLGIGLVNTQERIKNYFGDQFGLRFESSPNKGTKVYVHIPCIQDYPKQGERTHV